MRIDFNLWPGGKTHAVTFSYDDGQVFDRRLIKILNQFGLRGTFHLNSAKLDSPGFVSASELRQLYDGHEIAVHMVTHPFPVNQPDEQVLWEFREDRRRLEQASGRVIRGMSYPFGNYDERVKRIAAAAGIVYGRTVASHGAYHLPEDWLAWHPTCHDRAATQEKVEDFLKSDRWRRWRLLYVWGHSYEFEQQNRWDSFTAICETLGEARDMLWCATNIEIYEYWSALFRLEFSVDRSSVTNPSAQPLWISVDGVPREIPAGVRDFQLS